MIPPGPRWLTLATVLVTIVLVGAACSRNSDSDSTATPVPATVPSGVATPATTPAITTGAATSAVTPSPTAVDDVGTPTSSGPLSGAVVTISDLVEDSGDYDGQAVLTHGYVDTVLSGNVVVLTDTSDQLLILGGEGALPEGLSPDGFVEVSGRVETFDAQRVAEELDISVDGLDVARFDGEPSLVVDAMRVGAVPVAEVSANPTQYEGRTIAVGGSITSVVDPRAFVLAPVGEGSPDDGLLVATAFAAVPGPLAEQARTQVVGRLARLDGETIASLDDALAFLAEPAYDAWRDQVIFIGDVVDIVAPAPTASVEAILAQPEAWEGKTVSVVDIVASRLTDRAIAIGFEGSLMVVGTPDQLPEPVAANATILVNGTVERFDPDNPPDIDGFDAAHPAVAARAGQPMIVATSVEVLPGS